MIHTNESRYPATAALTTGYVFRVENPATVYYLQRVGMTSQLVTVKVERLVPKPWYKPQCLHHRSPYLVLLCYLCPTILTLSAVVILTIMQAYWSTGIFFMLIFARILNTIVIRQRSYRGSLWKGAAEPGVHGDLLVLLSQDRWVRIKGLVDDLKAVTSGLWLADMTFVESSAISVATLLVYLAAAFATNMTQIGSAVLLVVLLVNTASLALANHWTKDLTIHGRILTTEGFSQAYKRRRDLADELIKSTGRKDWTIALGMVPSTEGKNQEVTM